MDEIASKYYVYLSSCKEGHDSCTEYSSMFHDMVHGHMLYDTVDFVLYQKDVPEIDLLSEVSPYLTNRRDCIGEGGSSYVCGEYKGYKVYVNDKMLKINTCSLCKYYYGTNMHDFPLEDVRKAIERIGEDLNIPMDKVTVTRLDLAEDWELQRSPIEYFNRMLDLPYFRRLSYPTGITFQTAEKELSFYDKGKEQGSNSKVKVSKESLPLDKIDGIKSFQDCILCHWVNRKGFDPLKSELNAFVRDGGLTQRNYKSIIGKIKRCCFSSQGKDVGPEMEEFDVKFRSFLKLKRFD